jgi:IS5 family transposase
MSKNRAAKIDGARNAKVRWKRGEKNQAVGRSRGGRNTKIHARADAKGRLIAILLTGGEVHDCPIAERLFRRVNSPERLLGDKAYDSTELRQKLDERRIKPVIPNRSNRKQPFSFNKRSLQVALARRERFQQAEGLQARRNTLRQAGPKLSRVSLPRSRPRVVALMSLDRSAVPLRAPSPADIESVTSQQVSEA